MAVVASGAISLVGERLALMLASCPAFRTLVGAADVAAALEHIYQQALPPPAGGAGQHTAAELAAYRPFAMIWTGVQDGYRFRSVSESAHNDFVDGGELFVRIEETVPGELDAAEADLDWLNTVGAIIAELCDLAGTGGFLNIVAGQLREYFRPSDDAVEDEGDYLAATLSVEWSG